MQQKNNVDDVFQPIEPLRMAPRPKPVDDTFDKQTVRRTMDKLGISLEEQKRLSGVAVDFVMDSVSVATSFKDKLAELGIIFCSMSEAVKEAALAVDGRAIHI